MNKYQYKVQGVDYEVEIEEVEGNIAKVNVNGIPFEVELQQPINAAKHPNIVKPKVEAPKPAPTASAPVAAGCPCSCCLRWCWECTESTTAWNNYQYQC
jgi:hypothetical protein